MTERSIASGRDLLLLMIRLYSFFFLLNLPLSQQREEAVNQRLGLAVAIYTLAVPLLKPQQGKIRCATVQIQEQDGMHPVILTQGFIEMSCK